MHRDQSYLKISSHHHYNPIKNILEPKQGLPSVSYITTLRQMVTVPYLPIAWTPAEESIITVNACSSIVTWITGTLVSSEQGAQLAHLLLQ